MAIITFIHPDGHRSKVPAAPGDSVMEAAIAHGIEEIVAECGGSAVCGTCHVFVDMQDLARLPAPKPLEDELLDVTSVPRQEGSRLSCQLFIGADDRGLTVTLPASQT
jgi:2Fe-2S ferredoxin